MLELLPLLLAVAPASAGETPVADPAAALDFFIGACWQGTFPDGETTDTHCFRPVFGGRFVRDNHLVDRAGQRYAGETLYRWNADAKQFDYTYWDSNGGVSRGSLKPDGRSLRSPAESYTGADGEERLIASVWTVTGNDTWEQSAVEIRGGTTSPLWTIRYRRIAAADLAAQPCLAPCERGP